MVIIATLIGIEAAAGTEIIGIEAAAETEIIGIEAAAETGTIETGAIAVIVKKSLGATKSAIDVAIKDITFKNVKHRGKLFVISAAN